jgi:hypothetical protein
MTPEEVLKDFILSRYKSVHAFTESIGMPYGTISSIFKRGIQNSSIANMIRICKALNISADALANGKIVPSTAGGNKSESVAKQLIFLTDKNISDVSDVEIDGVPLSSDEADFLLASIETAVEVIRRRRKK